MTTVRDDAAVTTTYAVQVRDLVKRYPKRPVNAVDGISFEVSPGEIFGLLGPNGAGKTTTVGILTTRVRLTSGQAMIGGVDVSRDPVAARRRLAVVPQRVNLDRSLSARQNLVFHAAYHGIPPAERARRADQLLEQFGLADRGKDKVDKFSGGQSQRLMIARALMHEPDVLFLDEPSTGLDPQARLFVWERIRELKEHGVTMVLTTHDMDEAAELADRVGIVDHGKLLALDTPENLTRGLSGRTTLDITVTLSGQDSADDVLAALLSIDGVERGEKVAASPAPVLAAAMAGMGGAPGTFGGGNGVSGGPATGDGSGDIRLRLYLTGDAPMMVGPVAQVLAARGARLADVHIGTPSLEDVFIHLTGRSLR